MAQKKYTTKRSFCNLTSEKRVQIDVLLQLDILQSRIARLVGIARSTPYNELSRGMVCSGQRFL